MATAEFRTDDMALATVLVMREFEIGQFEKLSRNKVVFIFSFSDERQDELDEILGDYDELSYKVEPKTFIKEVAKLRSRIYEIAPPSRRSVQPTA